MFYLTCLAIYLFSVLVNAFIVRLLNKWLGETSTTKSLVFCALGVGLWVILLVVAMLLAGAWVLDWLERVTEDWFNPKPKP